MIKERVTKFLGDLQKGRPLDPPAAPEPTNMESHPFELPVPYALEEMPRTFLHLLKISDEVPPQVKAYITTWLDDFDARLVAYMHQRYGEGVDQVMEAISRGVMNQQADHAASEAKATERDVLDNLEKQLREEGIHGDGKRAQAQVPLDIAEFLRVTLQIAKQSASLSSEQKARIGMVIAMYECRRDEVLLNAGFTQHQIDGYVKSAALALANYFEDKANETLEGGGVLDPCVEDADVIEGFEEQFRDHVADPDEGR